MKQDPIRQIVARLERWPTCSICRDPIHPSANHRSTESGPVCTKCWAKHVLDGFHGHLETVA